MNRSFSAVTIVTSILDSLGYKSNQTANWVNDELGYGEYRVIPSSTSNKTIVTVRSTYGVAGHKRYCILRVDGQQIRIHGSKIDCSFVNLANPGSLSLLRSALSSIENFGTSIESFNDNKR